MGEDSSDDDGVLDKGKDVHRGTTVGTNEWVNFIDFADQLGPTFSEGCRRQGSLFQLKGISVDRIFGQTKKKK